MKKNEKKKLYAFYVLDLDPMMHILDMCFLICFESIIYIERKTGSSKHVFLNFFFRER